MTDRFCTVLSGCICTWMLFAPTAEAADGRIAFSGSIVVPTCDMAIEPVASARVLVRPRRSHRRSCVDQSSAKSSGSAYAIAARRLTHVETDPVLNYFDSYVSANRADAVPMLVTQTYE